MTKPTNTTRTSITTPHRGAHENAQPLRVALRLWGFDEREVLSWMSGLPGLNGSVSWKISHVRDETNAEIVVHLVNFARRSSDAHCWNCIGANRALSESLSAGRTGMVLFAGNAGDLPPQRAGLWALAGTLSPQAALGRLGRLIAASSVQRGGRREAVRLELLGMIAQELDAG